MQLHDSTQEYCTISDAPLAQQWLPQPAAGFACALKN
jgi:hypothetical protein